MTAALFRDLVDAELDRIRVLFQRYNSAHEAYGLLLEEVEEFKDEVFKKREERSPEQMLAELVQVGAVAHRAAESLDLCPDETNLSRWARGQDEWTQQVLSLLKEIASQTGFEDAGACGHLGCPMRPGHQGQHRPTIHGRAQHLLKLKTKAGS